MATRTVTRKPKETSGTSSIIVKAASDKLSHGGLLLSEATVQEIADELLRRDLSEEEQRGIIGAVLRLCADCMQLFKTHLPAEGYGFVQALRDQLHEWFVFWGHARGCDS